MKRIIALLLACVCFLAGCSTSQTVNSKDVDVEKKSRIEIFSTKDDLLSSIDDQDIIHDLLNNNDWSEVNKLPENLIPECKLLVYQEKTLLAGQDPNAERGYELIETIILFEESPYIVEAISSDVIKNMKLSSDALTFYYKLPDSTIDKIHDILNS